MSSTLFQLTLRRWVAILTNKNFYLIFAVVVVCSAAMGPFGTYDRLALVHRFGFWFVTHTFCWAIGMAFIVPVRFYLERSGLPKFMSFLIAVGLVNFLVGPAFVFALVWETGHVTNLLCGFQHLLMAAPVVALISYLVIYHSGLKNSPSEVDFEKDQEFSHGIPIWADADNCPVQQKLAVKNRGMILAMIAQDHYVDVVTDKGSELILMRLSDAADVCDDENSLRIHRSAWVSRLGVDRVQKDGRNTKVVLPDGRQLPVARSMESKLALFMKQKPCGRSVNISTSGA